MAKQRSDNRSSNGSYYSKGEIVIVKHSDPGRPPVDYISYVREDTSRDSCATLPLTNMIGQNGTNSRQGSRNIELMFGNIQGRIVRLVPGTIVESPLLGRLYEVECKGLDSEGHQDPEGPSFKIVGCYSGINSVCKQDSHVFLNVVEADPERLDLKRRDKKDNTYGRRVFGKVKPNEVLVIRELSMG